MKRERAIKILKHTLKVILVLIPLEIGILLNKWWLEAFGLAFLVVFTGD